MCYFDYLAPLFVPLRRLSICLSFSFLFFFCVVLYFCWFVFLFVFFLGKSRAIGRAGCALMRAARAGHKESRRRPTPTDADRRATERPTESRAAKVRHRQSIAVRKNPIQETLKTSLQNPLQPSSTLFDTAKPSRDESKSSKNPVNNQ